MLLSPPNISACLHNTSETVKRVLNLPEGTIIQWRSHDESIAQRTAIDQARQDRPNQEKRRVNPSEENQRDKTVS
jgi:translation initiation factor 4E